MPSSDAVGSVADLRPRRSRRIRLPTAGHLRGWRPSARLLPRWSYTSRLAAGAQRGRPCARIARKWLRIGHIRSIAARHSSLILSCSCYLHGCKCGFFGDSTRECRCTPGQIQRYLGKISGPLLDRIDIHVEVPAVPYKELRGQAAAESSAGIRGRIGRARTLQEARGGYNSRLSPARSARSALWTTPASARWKWPSAAWAFRRARTTAS